MILAYGIALVCTIITEAGYSRLFPPRPNEIVLLDSRESGWECWTKNTASDIGWRQQSRPGAGYSVYGLCESSSTTKRDEFWLFGPLIPLVRALSVHVQVNFMLRSCTDREIVDGLGGACRENFDVFLQQEALRSDMDVADVPRTDSFKKLATISSDRKWSSTYPLEDTAVTSWLIRFRPQTERKAVTTATKPPTQVSTGWMRLAIRDHGACLMLDRIRIYYLACPAWQISFMSLPETPAGHDAEVREAQGHCVSGAEPLLINQSDFIEGPPLMNQSKGLKPSFCKANGQWHILKDNICECLPGFEASVEENSCTSCPLGTYKALSGPGFCRPCPPNSISEASIGSKRCVCSNPLFVWHVLPEGGSGVCSPKLQRVSDIQIVEKNAERIIISWRAPVSADAPIFVAISCLNCQKDEAVYVPGDVLTGNRVTILGLQSDRTYTFAFRSCLQKDAIPDSCDVRAIHATVKQGHYSALKKSSQQGRLHQNATESTDGSGGGDGDDDEDVASVVTVFHILLGIAIFICMTILFVFGTVLLHRYYKRRPHKRLHGLVNNAEQPVSGLNTTAMEYRNALFQAGQTSYHQLLTVDPTSVEMKKPLGKCRHGETFSGLLKLAPPVENNVLPARKVFLRPALPNSAVRVAEIAASIRHPRIVFCHGILKAVQPHLLVYDFMALGRLDKFLISEIGRFEGCEEYKKSQSRPHSPLLSTKTVFHMLHQIASAFAFLVSLSIDNLRLDSSSVLVSSNYCCKVQLKTCPPEATSNCNISAAGGVDVGPSLKDFLDVRPSSPHSKVFIIQDGQHVLLPSILKPPTKPPPSRVFESTILSLKLSGSEDPLANNSMSTTAPVLVKNLGWLQVEVLLASVFCQRCTLCDSATSSSNVSEKVRRILRHLEWGETLRLRENILTLIARWFGNDFLGCMLSSCVNQEASRRPGLMEVVNHLQNYLTDGDPTTRKAKITAVIHGDGMIPLPIVTPVEEVSTHTTPTKWNNLHLSPSPCAEVNPFYTSETV
uniref:Ephrin type A receptor 4 A n=1 Tax=Echinococcus granulosus TaxID=6210 RepID=A0A068X1F6_ECHGR|nr:ephrin type A receptor 4 A [Echinococcus granulosus]